MAPAMFPPLRTHQVSPGNDTIAILKFIVCYGVLVSMKGYPIGPFRLHAPVLLGFIVAIVALSIYGPEVIVAEDFALRKDDHRGYEELNGVRFTAASATGMQSVLEQHVSSGKDVMLWLGNSQLHTINQYSEGDHLSPYWLRQLAQPRYDIVPLGFSLPNANLQEQLIITRYTLSRSKPKLILVQLVFDDLREDDLRSDFALFLTPAVREQMERTAYGKGVLGRLDTAEISDDKDVNGLEGFVQQVLEAALTRYLAEISALWAKRPNLRAKVLTDLYLLRNVAFGIKPTSVRRMIPLRYERNMQALEAIFSDGMANSTPVLAYVAPLRPDVAAPYDASEYRAWKNEVAELARRYEVRLLDLEALVPGSEWGTYSGDDVDFMHFKGSGHIMVSRTLHPVVIELLGGK